MSNDYRDPAFKKWLDKLQQESWQLELIISGFAIYGLFVAFDPLLSAARESQNDQHLYQFIASAIGLTACAILLFNLLLHVVLRGLWIGALGLRYVSGDIEYEKLRYSDKFNRYLKKRIGSFDKYIATLENYCSILFAVSFLLIFYFLGIVTTLLSIAGVGYFIIDDSEGIQQVIGIILVLFIVIGMFLTFFDFITQGLLKRYKWVGLIYFPVYWVFSFITLSFLYRPLVYNFLDNRFGKRLMLFLVPFYALLVFVASLEYRGSNYFSSEDPSSSYFSNSRNYANELEGSDNFVRIATIQSKVVTDGYLHVFVLLTENVESYIYSANRNLNPNTDRRGLRSNMQFMGDGTNQFSNSRRMDSLKRAFVETVNETYRIRIDSVEYPAEFVLTSNKKEQLGFESYVNIKNLAEGKHVARVTRLRVSNGDSAQWTRVAIPFWYFEAP